MDTAIWIITIIVSIVLLVLALLTSVSSLHKRFIEKPFEKREKR